MSEEEPTGDATPLADVIAAIRRAGRSETLSVQEILAEIGDKSFATALLVPALILISPISGIPGVPTIGALIVILIVGQWIARRRHLWLPGFIMRRTVPTDRMNTALDWLDRPAAFVDRHSHPRLRILTSGPLRIVTLAAVLLIAAAWPVLEILPLVTSVGAFAVSLFAFGLMTRDGAYVAAGYVFVGIALGVVLGLV